MIITIENRNSAVVVAAANGSVKCEVRIRTII